MSTVRRDISVVAEPAPLRDGPLPRSARLYFMVVAAATAGATLPFVSRLRDTNHWGAFLVLGTAAAAAVLFRVHTPREQAYDTAIVFLVAGAFLLPPELVALTALVQHIPEWLKARHRWYLHTFNMCNFVLASMAVWVVAHYVIRSTTEHTSGIALAGLLACVVFVAINHTVLALMLHFVRGYSLRDTGLFGAEQIATDLALAALGVATFAVWETSPLLVVFAVAPLVLVQRSLMVPKLREQARNDPKTGLFNARHFAATLSAEIARAERFRRPLSLLMVDLDLLREINNSYGHLAGDTVLRGIADVFRAQLRPFDVPARFGGEEFSILLPETLPQQALEIAERIRAAVEARAHEAETAHVPIRATVSIGVAGYPQDGSDPNELIHQADLAVYAAKQRGRNRVVGAGSEPVGVASGSRRG